MLIGGRVKDAVCRMFLHHEASQCPQFIRLVPHYHNPHVGG